MPNLGKKRAWNIKQCDNRGVISMGTKILLANANKRGREKLRTFFDHQIDINVVDETDSGRTAVILARELQPDVVIVDLIMPGMSGVEAARLIISGASDVKAVVIVTYTDTCLIAGIVSAKTNDYQLIHCDIDGLTRAVRAVMDCEATAVPA